jgi:ATP-grasp ribosomal peptide maturase
MAVLVLTSGRDSTADRVAAELALRGVPVIRLDPADFPMQVSITARICTGQPWVGGVFHADGPLVNLADVTTVWYRRPTQFQVDERMSEPERVFAYGEARRGFGGILASLGLGRARWVNDPAAALRAEYKPVQLCAASDAGLEIPESIITSDPQAAHTWAKELARPIVYKPLSGAWHAGEGKLRILYTSPVADPGELLDPALRRTAHLFQEAVPKAFEARAVVVGERVYTVRIDSASEQGRIDWRSDYGSLSYSSVELPADVSAALVDLHRRLGLLYGAADLICDPSGRWVFLETNQRGEWSWLESETGTPIAAALAELMAGEA